MADIAPKIGGLDYEPFREGQSPDGTQPTPEQLQEDMATLSRMTDTIRTYSVTHGLDAIVSDANNVGLDVVPTAFLNNERLYPWAPAENQAQVDNLTALLNKAPDNVPFAVVGNEAVKLQGFSPEALIDRINEVRANVPDGVILTTAETWDVYLAHPELAAAVDVIFVNIHPYFDDQAIGSAADYVISRYEELKAAYPGKDVIISETGWPTAGGANSGGSEPSSENQEFFLRDFWHDATLHDIPFFAFEAFDEPWKATTEPNGVGDHWGLYDSARQPKHGLVSLVPMQGTNGPDVIAGSEQKDQIDGGKGNDRLQGQGDDDILWGESGSDRLFGGQDADRFVFNTLRDGVPEVDVVEDYSKAEGDRIHLPQGIRSVASAALVDSTFQLTLVHDGDIIALPGVADVGNDGIMNDLMVV